MLPSLSRLKIADLAEKTDHFDLKVVPTASPRVEERVAASRADVGRLQRSSFVGSANTRLPKPIVPKFDQCGEFFGSVFETSSEMPGLPVVSNTTSTQKLELLIYLFGDSISTVDINDDSFRITNKESLSKIIEVARQQNKTLGCEAAEMGIDQSSMSDVERQCQVHTRVAYYAIQTNTHYRGVRGLLFLSMENNLIERYEKYKKLSDKQQQEVKGQVDTNNYPKEALTDRAYQPKNPVVVQSVEWMTFDAARKRLAILVRLRKQCIRRLFLMAVKFYEEYQKIEIYTSQFISPEDKDDLENWFEYKDLSPRPKIDNYFWNIHLPWLKHYLFLRSFPQFIINEDEMSDGPHVTVDNIPTINFENPNQIIYQRIKFIATSKNESGIQDMHQKLVLGQKYPFYPGIWESTEYTDVKTAYLDLLYNIAENWLTRPSGDMNKDTKAFINYYMQVKEWHFNNQPDEYFFLDDVIIKAEWNDFLRKIGDSNRISAGLREIGIEAQVLDDMFEEYEADRPTGMDQQDFDMQQNVARVKKSLEALKNFEGMDTLKEFVYEAVVSFLVDGTACLQRFNNFAFLGPSGVGKTTWANLVGNVFGALGMFMYGDLVETKSGDFISTYLGQTEPKTRSRMDLSLEKVLLIDEAYSIGANQTYGTDAITAIVDYTSINIGLLMVIVAGYEKDMKENFFDLNEGLQRRFENVFVFEAYSPQELSNILKNGLQKVSQSNPDLGSWEEGVFKRIEDLVRIGRQFDAWAKKGDSSLELMFEEEGRQISDAYDQLFSKQAGSIQTILSKARRYMGVPDKQKRKYGMYELLQVLQACLAPNLRKKLQITTDADVQRVQTSPIYKFLTNQLVFKFGGYTPTADEMVTLFVRGVRNLPGNSAIPVGMDVETWLRNTITIGRLCSIEQVAEFADVDDCPTELYGFCHDFRKASEFLGSEFFKVVYSTFLAKKTKSIELLVQIVGTYAQSTRVVALNVDTLNTILYEKLEAMDRKVDKMAFKKDDPSGFDQKLKNLWLNRKNREANRLYSAIVALAVASALQDEGRELPVSMYAGIIWRTSSLVGLTTLPTKQGKFEGYKNVDSLGVEQIGTILESIYDVKNMVRTYTLSHLGKTDIFTVDTFVEAFKSRLVDEEVIGTSSAKVDILETHMVIDNVWAPPGAGESTRQSGSQLPVPEIVIRELASMHIRTATQKEIEAYEDISSNYKSTFRYFEKVLKKCMSRTEPSATFTNKAKEWVEYVLTGGRTKNLMFSFLETIVVQDAATRFYSTIQQTQLVNNVKVLFEYKAANFNQEMARALYTFASQLNLSEPQPGLFIQFPPLFYEIFFLYLILSAAFHNEVDVMDETRGVNHACNFLREALEEDEEL